MPLPYSMKKVTAKAILNAAKQQAMLFGYTLPAMKIFCIREIVPAPVGMSYQLVRSLRVAGGPSVTCESQWEFVNFVNSVLDLIILFLKCGHCGFV